MKTIALCCFLGLVCLAGSMPLDWEDQATPEYGAHFEGDILLSEEQIKSGINSESARWPNKTLRYYIDRGFTNEHLQYINDAMEELKAKTCIKFEAVTSDSGDYVFIHNGAKECSSSLGRQGGQQELILDAPCFNVGHGTAMHEMIHTLGFYHEHTRPDRDDYVTIYKDRIQQGVVAWVENICEPKIDSVTAARSNFDKAAGSIQYTAYDYGSIMHYGATAFAITKGQTTIEVKQTGKQIGQRDKLSQLDAAKINAMYKC